MRWHSGKRHAACCALIPSGSILARLVPAAPRSVGAASSSTTCRSVYSSRDPRNIRRHRPHNNSCRRSCQRLFFRPATGRYPLLLYFHPLYTSNGCVHGIGFLATQPAIRRMWELPFRREYYSEWVQLPCRRRRQQFIILISDSYRIDRPIGGNQNIEILKIQRYGNQKIEGTGDGTPRSHPKRRPRRNSPRTANHWKVRCRCQQGKRVGLFSNADLKGATP
jgi:hypothetical protein